MRYVALLRGVNVGGRTILMADLRACFDDMGFDDVTTVVQTGNVLFNSEAGCTALRPTIEEGLRVRFDHPVHVQVYSLAQLKRIIESSPFDGRDPQMHSYVVFFEGGLERQLMVEAGDVDIRNERVQAGKGVLYWLVPKGSTLTSEVAHYLTKARYKNHHTNRNINTLRKIAG